MTIFHLVRHGPAAVPEGVLVGRQPGFALQADARRQVQNLVPRLARESVSRLYASPLERTQETAHILAEGLGLRVQAAEELIELDFGLWTGKSIRELDPDPGWRRFNAFRSGTRIPQGEWMFQIQARAVDLLLRLRDQAPGEAIVLVSHGDVIRPVLAYFLGMPLDLLLRIEVQTASVSSLRVDDHGAQVLAVNWTA